MKEKIQEIYKKKNYRPVGAFIVRNNKNKFLIVESAKAHNFWSFPQGGIDKKESLQKNIKRELKEELGIKPTEIKILKKGFYIRKMNIPEARGRLRGFTKGKIYFFSLISYKGNKKLKLKKDEVQKYLWTSKKGLISKISSNKKQIQKAEITKKALEKIK
jgi:8-oxo-dGTP pyrophosphatase MutT (NUDIX family)